MRTFQKKLSPSFFAVLSLPATAMGFALSVQIAALSWILLTKFNLHEEDIGLIWAAGPIAGIFGQVIIGIWSDNVWFWGGRRRPFILIGGTIAALMLLALPNIGIITSSLGFSGIVTVAACVALMLDLAINVSFNPTRAIIADVTPEGKIRTGGYTWMQTVSGTFGVGAYLISVIWDNYVLINVGVVLVLVFSVLPTFLIKEPKSLEIEDDKDERPTLKESLKTIFPLLGFLIFGLFGIINRAILGDMLGHLQTNMMYVGLALSFIGGFVVLSQSVSKEINKLEFQKILLAHAFTWLGIQCMFVYFTPYISSVVIPTLQDGVIANSFSAALTGKDLASISIDDTTGNIVALSFLFLNLVAAILPTLVLAPLAQRIGRVKTHMLCIFIAAAGYFGLSQFGTSELMIYLLISVVGIGWAATISLPFAIMSERVDQTKMGLYMGIFNLSVVLPQLMSSLGIGKLLSESNQNNLLFYICGAALAVSGILWLFVRESKETDAELAPSGGH